METKPKQVLNIYKKHEVSSYPYGRLRTHAYFSVEFKPKFGFRSVFQTINPKTGKLNAPKKGTYYTFAYNYINPDNGHIEYGGFNTDSFGGVNRLCKFLAENNEALGRLDKEMVTEICCVLFNAMRGNARYCPVGQVNAEKLIAIIDEPTKLILDGFKTGVIDFGAVAVDEAAIEALKQDYINSQKPVAIAA